MCFNVAGSPLEMHNLCLYVLSFFNQNDKTMVHSMRKIWKQVEYQHRCLIDVTHRIKNNFFFRNKYALKCNIHKVLLKMLSLF